MVDQSVSRANPRRVFVVHGRNRKARDAMFAFLRSLDLSPIEWDEAVNLSGVATPFIGQVLTSAMDVAQAVVVVLTGDDEARLLDQFRDNDEAPEPLTPQPRANVLFEAGLAFGYLPDRTILVEMGSLRRFSDVTGRHSVQFRTGDADDRARLRRRLEQCGCVLGGGSDWLREGDFEAAIRAGHEPGFGGNTPSAGTTSGSLPIPRTGGGEPQRSPGRVSSSSDIPGSESGPTYRTLVVDPLGRGGYTSIGDAIRAAKPGDHVRVRPGLYQEALVINKPLEIVGEGNRGEVRVEAKNKVVLQFDTSAARVENIAFVQSGGDAWHCVDILRGRLVLEGCDVSNRGHVSVAIRSSADPVLRNNTIRDSQSCGVFVYDGGRGTLEGNDIFGSALSGVEIKEGGDPTLRKNSIHDNEGDGVVVHTNGKGTLEGNEIFGNVMSGVEIRAGSNPTLRKNSIRNNKTDGVLVHMNGKGTLEGNEIFGNTLSGVEIREGGDPTLRNNTIRDGNENGVLVHLNGKGTLEGNEIFGNGLSGVEIREGGDPTLRNNTIRDGKTNGVYAHKTGRGTLEGNTIAGNTFAGVRIGSGSKPTLKGNRINRNGTTGVVVFEGGGGTFEQNDLTGNAKGAWEIDAQSAELVKRVNNQE